MAATSEQRFPKGITMRHPTGIMNRDRRAWLCNCFAIACLISIAAIQANVATRAVSSEHSSPQIGDTIGQFSFTDIRFLPRSLSDFVSNKDPIAKRAFVLVFTNTTCPLVQKYLPRLKQLDAEFRGQGV